MKMVPPVSGEWQGNRGGGNPFFGQALCGTESPPGGIDPCPEEIRLRLKASAMWLQALVAWQAARGGQRSPGTNGKLLPRGLPAPPGALPVGGNTGAWRSAGRTRSALMDGGGAPGNPSGVTVFSLTGEGMSRDGRLPPWNADIRASAVAACREEVVLARWGRPSGLLCFPPPPRRRAGHLGPKDTTMLFPRDTADPDGDLGRGFSGYSGAWFATLDDGLDWRQWHPHDAIHPVRQDPVTGLWCANPEWGLSALAVRDAASFGRQLHRLCGEWGAGCRPLAVFESGISQMSSGADGEDCFRGGRFLGFVPPEATWDDVAGLVAGMAPFQPDVPRRRRSLQAAPEHVVKSRAIRSASDISPTPSREASSRRSWTDAGSRPVVPRCRPGWPGTWGGGHIRRSGSHEPLAGRECSGRDS